VGLNPDDYPFKITIRPIHSGKHLAIIDWLELHMGRDIGIDAKWAYCYFGSWGFKSEEDAVLFAMIWA
jgi:hypothetical protein